jgi:protein involved in polysaccharide export with SLBB domain
MDTVAPASMRNAILPPSAVPVRWLMALLLVSGVLSGCAAVSNPVANGIPVRLLPPELLTQPREDMQTIPLTALRQRPPDAYRLAAGDVLGVWIENVLGQPDQLPPVTQAAATRAPAIGLPVAVRADGTVPLPQVAPVRVEGLTLGEAEKAVVDAYTVQSKVLKPNARIIVTLARPRQYHILVIRQDSGGLTIGPAGVIGNTKRGTGAAIDLPAYENDVLNALAVTGGFPGLDAVNEVVIERGAFNPDQDPSTLLGGSTFAAPGCNVMPAAGQTGQFVRIPIRMRPGEPLPFRPEDVVLQSGDIIFIEERNTETWYSGGLLPPAEHILPRDRDLDVIQAIVQGGFELVSPGVSSGNLTGTLIAPGIGTPIPSLLSVIRRTPNGQQVVIRVDANRALRDPRERLLIQAGDIVILQETPSEAFARYILQKLDVSFSWQFIHGPHESATAATVLP